MLMPAIPLLLALCLAFAGDAASSARAPSSPAEVDAVDCLIHVAIGLSVGAVVSMGLGLGLTAVVRGRGYNSLGSRRALGVASGIVQAMDLAIYAWLIHALGWAEYVNENLGLRGAFLLDELLILAPFLLANVIGWWGLYPAVRVSRGFGSSRRAVPYLVNKARLTFGMILPALVLFWAGNDLTRLALGSRGESPAVQVGVMVVLAAALLVISPAFVRLAWPSRPLPPGPLRDRLDAMARRFRFRYTDILVWDTEGTVFNAVVTGASPWFRYVLLSDAIVEHLDEPEIAAVFGHEMGHIRHRHLASFGFFFLGSLGVLALVGQAVDAGLGLLGTSGPWQSAVELGRSGIVLGALVAFYWVVFGGLSRRFERQADVFGCLAVSCGRVDCNPQDHYAESYPTDPGRDGTGGICRLGIRSCINALETVAAENGVRPEARSWRHGSIARRIAFLESLADRPSAESAFQAEVRRHRAWLAAALGLAVAVAVSLGAFETFRKL